MRASTTYRKEASGKSVNIGCTIYERIGPSHRVSRIPMYIGKSYLRHTCVMGSSRRSLRRSLHRENVGQNLHYSNENDSAHLRLI